MEWRISTNEKKYSSEVVQNDVNCTLFIDNTSETINISDNLLIIMWNIIALLSSLAVQYSNN